MIRTFKLQNANGQTYDLTPAENFNTGVFLDPAGLGVTYNNNLYQIGNRFAVINRKRLAKNISGKLLFPMPESYKNYEKFARFIDKVPLKLLYNPTSEETNEYEFEVEIKELTKTEIEEGGLLCNLKFNALTLPRKVIFIESEKDETFKNTLQVPYELNALKVESGGNIIDDDGQQWLADYVDFKTGVLVKNVQKTVINNINEYVTYTVPATGFIDVFGVIGKPPRFGYDKTFKESISNYFNAAKNKNYGLYTYTISFNRDAALTNIVVPFTEKESAKEYLNSLFKKEPLIILYTLANSEQQALSDSEILAFKKMMTYEPVTYVKNDKNIELAIEYTNINNKNVSVTGKEFKLEDTTNNKFKNIKVFGKSSAKGNVVENNLLNEQEILPWRSGSRNEFQKIVDLAPLFDHLPKQTFTISLDIKTLKKTDNARMQVYMQSGNGSRYDFIYRSVPVTTTFKRYSFTSTPTLSNPKITNAHLALYGGYGTGNTPVYRNIKLEFGDKDSIFTGYADRLLTIHSIDNPIVYSSNTPIGTDVKKNYNYKYNYQYSDGATNTITLDVDVSEPSPVELIIRGYTENPKWKHYVNGELVATGQINATILDGNSLVVSSELPKMQILQKDNLGNVVNDLYQNSVWDTERFLFLRRGKNVITVSDESSSILNISLKGFLEYATI